MHDDDPSESQRAIRAAARRQRQSAYAMRRKALVSRFRARLMTRPDMVKITPSQARFWPRPPLVVARTRASETTSGASVQKALVKILAAVDSYFVLRQQFPGCVRLGPAIATAFLGRSTGVHFPLRPTEPHKTELIIADPTLAPTQIELDD
jgi:hypothetical protein